jgi:hypothetical protein
MNTGTYKIIYPDFSRIEENLRKYNEELDKISTRHKKLLRYNRRLGYDSLEVNRANVDDSGLFIPAFFTAADFITFALLLLTGFTFFPIRRSIYILLPILIITVAYLIYLLIIQAEQKKLRISYRQDITDFSEKLPEGYMLTCRDDTQKYIVCHDLIDEISIRNLKKWKSDSITKVNIDYDSNRHGMHVKITPAGIKTDDNIYLYSHIYVNSLRLEKNKYMEEYKKCGNDTREAYKRAEEHIDTIKYDFGRMIHDSSLDLSVL